MPDVAASPAAPHVTRREDYRPPEWLVPDLALDFTLDAARTLVRARLEVVRNGDHKAPLRLDASGLHILDVRLDGETVNYWFENDVIRINVPGDSGTIETEVAIAPKTNTQLMGLYESGGMLCTQCEAEGFRRITPFPDRPDVLTRYRVRMSGHKAAYPILLSNGNPVASGEDGKAGTHWAEWEDPFPKPCYLFALVAGDLVANRDNFVTRSGRTVDLAIWVREGDLPRTEHAMASLKAAMKWDEQVYGREYDLAMFNIVAVDDFNFGAMENKSLNIFNSRYILADPDTATDMDYDGIAGVVAHEYFHNWSGNRVTCRDWFQLSLKEGFTVFRDQSFSADMGSEAVKRIEDVRLLRAAQFPEDAGPLAHPVRPDSYIEISNFYTATVYNKGAELIRMLHTILGPEKFRAGCDLYFASHDGEAVTCEDFVRAMEEASGEDLAQFRLWYSQAGTPKVKAQLVQEGAVARVLLEQEVPPTPGQKAKQPMPIPLKLALFGARTGAKHDDRLFILDGAKEELVIDGLTEPAVLSVNRDFSAPVIVETDRGAADLAFLSGRDDDPFARYEAMQQLMLDTLKQAVSNGEAAHEPVIEAVRETLANQALDPASFPPSEAFIGDHMKLVDPEAIHRAREALRAALGTTLESLWRDAYATHVANRYEYNPAAKGARRLRTIALGYLAAAGAADAPAIAKRQYDAADNMTDRQGALGVLANGDAPEREAALAAFYDRYRNNGLVLDKWFSTQALSTRADTPAAVEALARHPDFTLALSHKLNPQTAAKLVPPLGRWRRFGEDRAKLMRAALERIVATPGLSKDVYEQASKSLA